MTGPLDAPPLDPQPAPHRGPLQELLVVVPARDEARLLLACLGALRASADHLAASPSSAASASAGGPPVVRVLVVLDRCRDGSAALVAGWAARWAALSALASIAGTAGGARRAGAELALAGAAARGSDPARTWLASTDADSRVPRDWLAVHAAAAADGVDLLLGTAVPDPAGTPPALLAAWAAGYDAREGHGHVHGASLGVRASAWSAAGGWPAVATDEDVLLAAAVAATGAVVRSTAAAPVVTSGRLRGRAPAGFADHLAGLAGL